MLSKINDYCWEINKTVNRDMRVPGRIYASEPLIKNIYGDDSIKQLANVACLPGIVKYSLAMPDMHCGYGFPIGGVAATDIEGGGIISPGGIGYDINCGVRVMSTNLTLKDIAPRLDKLVHAVYSKIPVGVGGEGAIRLNEKSLKKMLSKGAAWAVEHGYGNENDLNCTESNGCLPDADPSVLSQRAIKRGLNQPGTLGSGNHFIEIQEVDHIYDNKTARVFGLEQGQIVVMLHTGSRGLGYQVCDDYIRFMRSCPSKYGFTIPDRQLVCAPFKSPEGQQYFSAVCAAANFAWANRQYLMGMIRNIFEHIFNASAGSLGLNLIYDVAHNIAKVETHEVDGKKKQLCVHRKGATRAFPAGHSEIPAKYKSVGQPVLVPGDMGTSSYIMVGTRKAMEQSFGSVCHGAGRVLSRSAAKRKFTAQQIVDNLHKKGIVIMAKGKGTIVEEASEAYKDIDEVTASVEGAGLAKKVARMKPLGVVKG